MSLFGLRFLALLLLELCELFLLGIDLLPQLLELFTFVPPRVLVLMGLFLLVETLGLSDGTLRAGDTAAEHWSSGEGDTASDGIPESNREHR